MDRLITLRELIIYESLMSDLSFVTRLRSLKTLYLVSTRVEDYSPLGQLEQLNFLGIAVNVTHQLDSLVNIRNLSGLGLFDNRITDLSPLSYISNLTFLSIGYLEMPSYGWVRGPTSVSDLTPLASLPKLTKLHISSTEVTDLSPLKHMMHLQLDARSTPELVEQWRSFGNQVVDDIWADEDE